MASLGDLLLAHTQTVRLAFLVSVVLGGVLAAVLADADLRRCASLALERAGWPRQAAAAQIGISRQRLGHQLDGADPFTCFYRLAGLEGFWPALMELSASSCGITVVHNADLAQILGHLQGNKVMARMNLTAQKAQQTA
jgi:hypothetical protein